VAKQAKKNNVFLITGASSGIGKAVALALSEPGVSIAIGSRNIDQLNHTANEITARGGEALIIPVDVTDRDQVDRMVQKTDAHWGKIDVLISNAGQYIRAPILEMKVVDLERSMAVNFYGHVHGVMAVLPIMRRQGSGHIILVSTMDAKKAVPPDAPYISAKCALSGFGDVIRQELQPLGISVTTIFPGRVDTPMISNLNMPWVSAKISPETTAKAIVRAIQIRPAEVILPPQAVLLHLVNVVSPRLADWFVRILNLKGWEA
jgi:NADP-dependent 3-hydroxy acid dehydrogenase YdfG